MPIRIRGKHHTEETKRKISIGNMGRSAWNKGIPHSVQSKIKMSISQKGKKKSINNPMWKGDDVGVSALHEWIKRRLIKSDFCQKCNKNKAYYLTNISGQYKRDLNDWIWLCRRCHMEND